MEQRPVQNLLRLAVVDFIVIVISFPFLHVFLPFIFKSFSFVVFDIEDRSPAFICELARPLTF